MPRDYRYGSTVLELRPNCELCDKDLPPAASDARICSYECTFCAECVDGVLHNVCPNCGGGFVPRPTRPRQALARDPAVTERRHTKLSTAEIEAVSERWRDVSPAAR
jgi:hypothetical protein